MSAQALAEHLHHAIRRMPNAAEMSDPVEGVFQATVMAALPSAPDLAPEHFAILVLPLRELGDEPTVRVVVDEDEIQHGVYLTEAVARFAVNALNLSNGGTHPFTIEDEPLRSELDPILRDA